MPDRQTRPVFARADGKLVAAALQEPSLTLFESHHVMGYFVAHGCQEDSFTGRFDLEEVIGQMRGKDAPWNAPWKPLAHDRVSVGVEDGGWTARAHSGELVASTGSTPFVVNFISPEDYWQLAAHVRAKATEEVLEFVRRLQEKLPPQTRALLLRWVAQGIGKKPPARPKETVRIRLPSKPQSHKLGNIGSGFLLFLRRLLRRKRRDPDDAAVG